MDESEKIERLKKAVIKYQDWPKPGICFWDVFSWLKDPSMFGDIIDLMVTGIQKRHGKCKIDAIVGLESRGFLFGPIIALRLSTSFVPFRKKGKLPGDLLSVNYTLEYGKDVIEVQKDAVKSGDNIIIVDDLLATGGTMVGACELAGQLGANVLECLVVIELDALQGRKKIDKPCESLIHSNDN
ncbi:adenine phosphoribosyltransferase-like [Tubulanus polymorphus]|uniref:adenine phosphoribosyltransferase-like n=1 Tax=Tubulanus polymorphus TaxID=672921 RepID=UPI003DA3B753